MTQQQLVVQAGAQAVPVEKYLGRNFTRESRLGVDFDIGSITYRAYLLVDPSAGLDMVVMKPRDRAGHVYPFKAFENLETALREKYGSPRISRESKGNASTNQTIHSTWILGTTAIDLQWWYIKDSRISGGFTAGVDITYEWRRTAADKL